MKINKFGWFMNGLYISVGIIYYIMYYFDYNLPKINLFLIPIGLIINNITQREKQKWGKHEQR